MSIFKFKHFDVSQSDAAMKIGTDSMVFGALIDTNNKTSGLDIGTGTGVLSLMVAQKNSQLQIKSIEIEEKAFAEAAMNFLNSPFSNQMQAIHGDFLEMESENQFDLIFSNPPYFENSSKSGIENRDLARHDNSLPLDLLFKKVTDLLSDNGHFWLILPHLTMDNHYPNALKNNLFPETEIAVFGKENQLVRKITAFSKIQSKIISRDLVVRNLDGTYTKEYKDLTKDYHFNVLK